MPRIIRLDNLEQFAAVTLLSDPGAIPGPVVVPQCAQVTLKWNVDSGKVANIVLYGRYAGSFAGTVAQANAILTALNTGAAWTALAAFLTTTSNLAQITLRNVNIADQPILASTGTPSAGTSAGVALPAEVAAVVTLRTAKTGPQNRGRMYVPGWASNAVASGNVMSAAAVTALNNWAATVPGALSAQGYTLVLGQKARQQYTGTTGRVHPARPAQSTDVTSLAVRDNHWDTQRRRGLK